jgi:nitroimidazol reductase NimA-like FMN-containing flavoprotein (pyridoxamine 5'-phosphate oxidase superfamily)
MQAPGIGSNDEIDEFLREAVIPMRLACLDREGHPRVLSLWYLWRDGALWCATSPRAWVVEQLRHDPRCGFEIAGETQPYRGVRGKAMAELFPERGTAVLAELVDRYLGRRDTRFARWLLERGDDEMAIRIVPSAFSSWDYSGRMK